MTPESLDRAEALLRQGIAIVGENALLRAGLGHVCWQRANLGIRPGELMAEAAAHAKAAIALDPQCPQAEHLLSLIVGVQGDMIGSVSHLRRALTIDPGNTDGLATLVMFYGYLGKVAAARPLLDRLISIDPLNPVHQATASWLRFVDGEFAAAAEGYDAARRQTPASPIYLLPYAQALACAGQREAACVVEQLEQEVPGTLTAASSRVYRSALRGDRQGVLDAVTPDVEAFARQALFASWLLADCLALVGEIQPSLAWLENAVKLGFINFPFLSRHDPLLARLRGEERFQHLMERVRERWEQFEA